MPASIINTLRVISRGFFMFECYLHINKINKKGYTGWCTAGTWNNRRWYNHKRDSEKESNLAFHRALRKYGSENFEGKLLATAKTVEEIKEIEIQMIKEHKTHTSEWGYNMTHGGDGTFGWNPSTEWKEKTSERMKGKRNALGSVRSEETRKKMSRAKKGENHPFYNKSLPKETREKMSESHRGNKHHFYGKTRSEETKKKIAESLRKHYASKGV